MTVTCPHCLVSIGWRKAWLAFIPGGRITCQRCQSRLTNNRSARTNQLVALGLIGSITFTPLSSAFRSIPFIANALQIGSFLATGLILMGLMGLGNLRVVRAAGRFCYRCGYNLTANASGICPECGGESPIPIDWENYHDEPLPADLSPKPALPPAEFELQIPASLIDPDLAATPKDVA